MSIELITSLSLLAVALVFLVLSADFLVKYSEKFGLSLGIPQFIIGITIISAGTSLPELVTSIFSIIRGEAQIVGANVIGSNIANILLVVGITTIIAKRVQIKRSIIRLDLPLLVGSGAILVMTMKDGIFTFNEAILSIIGFLVYLIYSITQHKESLSEKIKIKKKPPFKWFYVIAVLVSAVVLYFSADQSIIYVIKLGELMNLDTAVIAITAIAVGTSLPELIVSVVAAKKGNFDIAFGNILGSNIFNGFMVMGVSGMLSDLPIQESVLTVGIPFFIIATIFLVFSGIDKKFYNFEGALYLILYVLFIGQLFNFI